MEEDRVGKSRMAFSWTRWSTMEQIRIVYYSIYYKIWWDRTRVNKVSVGVMRCGGGEECRYAIRFKRGMTKSTEKQQINPALIGNEFFLQNQLNQLAVLRPIIPDISPFSSPVPSISCFFRFSVSTSSSFFSFFSPLTLLLAVKYENWLLSVFTRRLMTDPVKCPESL